MGCLKLTYYQSEPQLKVVYRKPEPQEKAVQRWLNVDPLSDKYPSTSPYMYTLGNPIMLIDPNGMFADDPPKGDCPAVTIPERKPVKSLNPIAPKERSYVYRLFEKIDQNLQGDDSFTKKDGTEYYSKFGKAQEPSKKEQPVNTDRNNVDELYNEDGLVKIPIIPKNTKDNSQANDKGAVRPNNQRHPYNHIVHQDSLEYPGKDGSKVKGYKGDSALYNGQERSSTFHWEIIKN